MTGCEVCLGYGWTRRDDGGFGACRCLRRERIRQYIDKHPELVGVQGVVGSPLVVDRRPYDGSCVLHGTYDTIKSHVVTWLAWGYVPRKEPRLGLFDSNALKEAFMGARLIETLRGFDLVLVRVFQTDNPLFAEVMAAIVANVRRTWITTATSHYSPKHAAWTELAEGWPVFDLEGIGDKRGTRDYFGLTGGNK